MRVTIIGSSHGGPEPHRKCTCILLETGGNRYFIDMGASVIEALCSRRIPFETVRGVFITHMHADHTNGLVEFANTVVRRFPAADPVICLPDTQIGEIIRRWNKANLCGSEKEIRYRETQPGVVFDDGVLKVTAIPNRHCDRSFSYLAQAEDKALIFTGDLDHPSVDFPAVDRPVDLAVCEAAHFEPTDYLPVFEQYRIRQVCVNHYSDRFLPGVLRLCAELNAGGIPALRATDDLELTV